MDLNYKGTYSSDAIYATGDVVKFTDDVWYVRRPANSGEAGYPCNDSKRWGRADVIVATAAEMAVEAAEKALNDKADSETPTFIEYSTADIFNAQQTDASSPTPTLLSAGSSRTVSIGQSSITYHGREYTRIKIAGVRAISNANGIGTFAWESSDTTHITVTNTGSAAWKYVIYTRMGTKYKWQSMISVIGIYVWSELAPFFNSEDENSEDESGT